MVGDPADGGQQPGPVRGIVQDDHRMRGRPGGERRDHAGGAGQQFVYGRDLLLDAQPTEQGLVRVDPDPPRQVVAADPAAGDRRPFDPEPGPPGGGRAAAGQSAQPGLDRGPALQQVVGARPADRERERSERFTGCVPPEQGTGPPPPVEYDTDVGDARPTGRLRFSHGRRGRTGRRCSACRRRYSVMVRPCSREWAPVGLSTKPTADTYGSITRIFCSGVTIISCRPSRVNSSRA